MTTTHGWLLCSNPFPQSSSTIAVVSSSPSSSLWATPITSSSSSNNYQRRRYEASSRHISKEERRQQSLDAGRHPLLSLNLNLDALARAKAPERAQELYQRIQALHQEGYYLTAPDICSFNSVLKAWQDDPEKALEFWEAHARPGQANVRSYNTFLLALAKKGLYESAESLLEQMQGIHAAVRPDRISFNTVLLAYATAMIEEEAAEKQTHLALRAEALLKQMMTATTSSMESNVTTVEPNNAQDFLLQLPPTMDPNYVPPCPDATSFNTLLSIWAAHGNATLAVTKAEAWLAILHNATNLLPDVVTYTTVLQTWCRPRPRGSSTMDFDVAQRVAALWQEMAARGVRPNRVTYTVALEALGRSGRLDAARQLFDRMLFEGGEVRPDTAACTALMDVWAAAAASGDDARRSAAVTAVQTLLQQMSQWPECTPNERTYTSVLKVYAASQSPQAGDWARQALVEMQRHAVSAGTIHYNAAMACYAKAPRATKAVDVERLWKEMIQNRIPCDTITYNTILHAAANSFGNAELKKRSFLIGQNAFDCLHDKDEEEEEYFCRPTSLSYSYYFKMMRRLLPATAPDRLARGKTAFDRCCANGCLNDIVLQQILNTTTPHEAKHIFGETNYENRRSLRSLPPDWSRHALSDLRRRALE